MFEKDPRTFSPEYKNLSPEQKAMVKLEITLTQFFKEFNRSVSRWERMVYPALIIFGLLGLSGFYLIYHVTKDMHVMSTSIDPKMESNLGLMAKNIDTLARNIDIMTKQVTMLVGNIQSMDRNIQYMNRSIASMDRGIGQINASFSHINESIDTMTSTVSGIRKNVESMDQSVRAMSGNVMQMNQSMKAMTVNTGVMTRDMRQMGRPMDMLNTFMPW